MLSTLIFVPFIGAAIISFINSNTNKGEIRIKQVALSVALVNFFISMFVYSQFDFTSVYYQFTQDFLQGQVTFCHFTLGIDGISLYFVLLSTFITPICILSNWENITGFQNVKYFLLCFLILESLLIAVFVVLDILLFYVFFESVLIPLFLIVGIWGGSAKRVRAAYLLFLYTLFGSLFMLLALLIIYNNVGSTDFRVVAASDIDFDSQKLLWLGIFISMAIKTPLAPTHIWLSRAHAEAPVGGSVILAGLILKLATYGYMRIILQFLPDASYYYAPVVQIIAAITVVYASLVTLRQTDFKALIAYSSVGHMGIVVLGLFSNTVQGIEGAIVLSIAHAFVSPGLFILVGSVLYDRFHTRTIRYYRGITTYMPVFSTVFFLFTLFNMAVPLSGNWLGEVLALTGTFTQNPVAAIIGSTGIILSAAYSIWLYNRIAFGSYSEHLNYTTDLTRREFMLLLPLLICTILLGIFPNVVLDSIHTSVSTLIYFV